MDFGADFCLLFHEKLVVRPVQDVESEGESFCGMPQIQAIQCPAVVLPAAEYPSAAGFCAFL